MKDLNFLTKSIDMKSIPTSFLLFYVLFFLVQIQRSNAQSTPLSISKKDFTKPKYDPNISKEKEPHANSLKQSLIDTNNTIMTPKEEIKARLLLNEQPTETPKKINEQPIETLKKINEKLIISVTKQSQY